MPRLAKIKRWATRAEMLAAVSKVLGKTVKTEELCVWRKRGAPIPESGPIDQLPMLEWLKLRRRPGRPRKDEGPETDRQKARWWRLRNRSLGLAIRVAERQHEQDLHPLAPSQAELQAVLDDLHGRLVYWVPRLIAEALERIIGPQRDFERLSESVAMILGDQVFGRARREAGIPPVDPATVAGWIDRHRVEDPGMQQRVAWDWVDRKPKLGAADAGTDAT